ncbi:hypothetical protein GW915_07675 [bacterium]|nr:hypothetical protein [bacterium]
MKTLFTLHSPPLSRGNFPKEVSSVFFLFTFFLSSLSYSAIYVEDLFNYAESTNSRRVGNGNYCQVNGALFPKTRQLIYTSFLDSLAIEFGPSKDFPGYTRRDYYAHPNHPWKNKAVISREHEHSIGWEVINKHVTLSYLACRESSGRPIAITTHENEGVLYKYGKSLRELTGIYRTFIDKQWQSIITNKNFKSWYSSSTNFGIFQISTDNTYYGTDQAIYLANFLKIDLEPFRIFEDELDLPALLRAIEDKFEKRSDRNTYLKRLDHIYVEIATKNEIAKFLSIEDDDELLDHCGTNMMFRSGSDPDPNPRKALRRALGLSLHYKGKDTMYASTLEDLKERLYPIQEFGNALILCPRLSLEIAKWISLYQTREFGPLMNHKKSNSIKNCGQQAKTCRAELETLFDQFVSDCDFQTGLCVPTGAFANYLEDKEIRYNPYE